jgi:hypothetical protein
MSDLEDYPPGDYAILELFGHTTLVGRIEEVERFGVKMLSIEALYKGTFLPAVTYGGASIYGLTPCSAEIAYRQAPQHLWALPIALRCIAPPDPPHQLKAPGINEADYDEVIRERPYETVPVALPDPEYQERQEPAPDPGEEEIIF